MQETQAKDILYAYYTLFKEHESRLKKGKHPFLSDQEQFLRDALFNSISMIQLLFSVSLIHFSHIFDRITDKGHQ